MLRIGVVGGGTYGQNHLLVYKDMGKYADVKLVALAEINDELRAKLAKQFGLNVYGDYHQMLEKEELDGVTVATPDHLHFQIAPLAFLWH